MGDLQLMLGNIFFVPSFERYVAPYRKDQTMDKTQYKNPNPHSRFFSREKNSCSPGMIDGSTC
jgi:hypothetical protein